MYAVVRTGGKQYRVSPGDVIRVEKLEGDAGQAIKLDEVLLLAGEEGIQLGKPQVAGASVSAEIVDQGRHPKLIIFKYRRRKRYRRKQGHRQPYTSLKINAIQTGVI